MCGATHRAIRLTGEKRCFLRVAERSDAHTSKPIAFAAPKGPRDGRAVLCCAVPGRATPKVNIIRIRCVRRAIRPALADALISQGLTKHGSALLVPNLELSAAAPRRAPPRPFPSLARVRPFVFAKGTARGLEQCR